MAATLFLTVGPFYIPPSLNHQVMTKFSMKGRSGRLFFWQARFLASSLKLIRPKVWAHELVFQKLTCIWESSLAFGLFQAHIFQPPCLAHVSSLSAGKFRPDHWKKKQDLLLILKRTKLLIILNLQGFKSFLTVDDFLLGLVDLLPHLPQYLLLHHLQVPRAPVPIHHRMCFWGILASKMGTSRVCIYVFI